MLTILPVIPVLAAPPAFLMVWQLSPGSFSSVNFAANQPLGRFDPFYKVAWMLLMVESTTEVL